jgi:hypothetical protein
MLLFTNDTTQMEALAWLCVFLNAFLLPFIIFLVIDHVKPHMNGKRSLAFYLGWIPGNLVSCFYLGLSCGFFDALMILVVCQVMQLLFVIAMNRAFVKMFGENAFR